MMSNTEGTWAVCVDGMVEWRRDLAIGDGITLAQRALVMRCATKGEADAEAARLNATQPSARLPGQPAVPHFAAIKYRRTDYICRQDLRNGCRDCDRRLWESR